jgi:hypothetical protein
MSDIKEPSNPRIDYHQHKKWVPYNTTQRRLERVEKAIQGLLELKKQLIKQLEHETKLGTG